MTRKKTGQGDQPKPRIKMCTNCGAHGMVHRADGKKVVFGSRAELDTAVGDLLGMRGTKAEGKALAAEVLRLQNEGKLDGLAAQPREMPPGIASLFEMFGNPLNSARTGGTTDQAAGGNGSGTSQSNEPEALAQELGAVLKAAFDSRPDLKERFTRSGLSVRIRIEIDRHEPADTFEKALADLPAELHGLFENLLGRGERHPRV
ncbi:MAG: hypothetical protein Q7K39_01625 [Candidatus Magasanikbacteria bacterium]|nr:hypothetical protein [Candidatus Magasanikbacteria bacterium]